ncbi:MAG: hypothetical protein ACLSFT_07845 [Ruminococcus callidus]
MVQLQPDHPNTGSIGSGSARPRKNTPCISISPWRTTPLFPSVRQRYERMYSGAFMTGLYWAVDGGGRAGVSHVYTGTPCGAVGSAL